MTTIHKFTEAHAVLLNCFLTAPRRPERTMTYPQLAGFLFSVACAPELIPPSEWLPIVFDEQDANYETVGEAEEVLQAMMSLYNDCSRRAVKGIPSLPPGCEIREEPLTNLDADAPLGQWARGFLMGHTWLDDLWNEFTPDSLDKELGASLMVLTFFSSPTLADAYLKEGKGKMSLERMAEMVVTLFPDAILEYAHMGQAIFQARRELNDPRLESSDLLKVGRNDPCPCGSGKKFKKCCSAT